MGYELSRWAKNLEHSCLTPRTRQVLNAICLIADDDHGEFWMRSKRLIAEHFPDMSHGTYRNCLSRLVRNELLIKLEHGGGRTTYGRGKTTRYRVNSLVVENPHPAQTVLPDIIRSPEALPPTLEGSIEQDVNATIEVQQRIAEWLSAGITHEQILETLKATGESLLGSPVNMSSPDAEKRHEIEKHVTNDDKFQQNLSSPAGETVHEAEKHVTDDDKFPDNMSLAMTCFDEATCHDEEEHVTDNDMFRRNMSLPVTSPHIHEKKLHEKKLPAAAAANLSAATEESVTSFFDLLATTLAKAGHPGIRAAQFADFRDFLADYANLTGSPPDQRTAEYIVGRVNESNGVRNVVGFARKITQDVLTTGEGYVALVSAPSPPPERPAGPSPPPDWNLLHLAHGEQVSSAQEIWDAVLDRLRSHVSKPAFETWLSEASGAAYAEGRFVVGSANSFASEMVKNRIHPLIVKAVREVAGVELEIQYAVVASDDRRECPLCQAEKAEVS